MSAACASRGLGGPILSLVLLATAWPSEAHAQVFFTPTIDGVNAEWSDQFHYLDGNEPDAQIPDNRDIRTTYVANNSTYLFFGIETYGSMGNISSFNLYIDRDNDGGGFDADDRVVVVTVDTNLNCTRIRVHTVDTRNGNPTGNGRNVGCNNNYGRVGSFLEVRVQLNTIGIDNSPTIGVISAIRPITGQYFNVSPSPPFPTFMGYDNSGSVTPTLIRVSALQARAQSGGVSVEWSTSSELLSLGTWVVRQTAGGEWQPVGGGPSPTGLAVAGARYRVLDPAGQAGDQYALAEVDARQQVLFFGPVVATADASAVATRLQQQAWGDTRRLGKPGGALRSVETLASAGAGLLRAPLPPLASSWPPRPLTVADRVLRVRVFRPGLHVVCDDDLWRAGWRRAMPVVTLQDRTLPVWRVPARLAGCTGHAFYAAPPASPYAPFDAYQLRPARRGTSYPALPEPGQRLHAPARSHSVERRSVRLSSPAFLDMGDGTPNRFFRQWVAGFAPLDLEARLPGALVGADVILQVEVRPSRVEPGSVHELVVTRAGGTASALAEGPGWRTVELTLPGAASETLALQLTTVDNGLLYGGMLVGDVAFEYPGHLALQQGRLSFTSTGSGWALVEGRASDQVMALDISNPLAALPLHVDLVGAAQVAVRLVPARDVPRQVLVLERSTLLEVALEPIDAEPAIDANSTQGEYLVLGPAALLPSLQPLLDLRRQQGLSVQALSLQAVYDRFSSSQPDPRAIAAVLKWAQEHWATPPRFVLLVGSTSYDPWGYQPGSPAADAPIQDHWLDSLDYRSWSDSLLVADAAGLPRAAVGRLPSSDPVALARYAAKVVDYESRLASAGRDGVALALAGRSQFAADPEFEVLAGALADATGLAAIPISMGAPGASEELAASWPQAELVLYVGHSDAQGWVDDALDMQSPAGLLSEKPPVVISATCMDGMFMRPTGSLSWALLDSPGGSGAILAISATSLLDPNIATGFAEHLLQQAQGATWGEAWLAAQLVSSDEMARSMVLVGDPALTARLPAPVDD